MKKIFRVFSMLSDWLAVRRNPVAYARKLGVKVGENVRLISVRPGSGTFGSEPYLISIGNHVTITGGVQFVNHDGGVWVFRQREPDIDVFGSIQISDNVFIGYGAILMPNIRIGSNCIIGAGSIVTKDVPDNSIAVGSPAKVINTVDKYYESIIDKKDNIRNMAPLEKRTYLEKKFGIA